MDWLLITKVINIGRGLGILSFVKNPPQKMKGSSMASPCILCRQDPDQLEIEDGSAEDPPPPAPLEDQAVAEPGAEPEVREPVTIATDTESESESGHGGGSQPVVGDLLMHFVAPLFRLCMMMLVRMMGSYLQKHRLC